ncbi:hypothetical protein DXG03_005598 [Asterophora parasitica]|uniref:Uncharacterized protein n=1 Tax=Asterophora parasitica TaxID=117018 RepID=A0A9P7K9T8_9AGAR|nr:hypothetical protein DXG03_005598 [Asterophora parasitica]
MPQQSQPHLSPPPTCLSPLDTTSTSTHQTDEELFAVFCFAQRQSDPAASYKALAMRWDDANARQKKKVLEWAIMVGLVKLKSQPLAAAPPNFYLTTDPTPPLWVTMLKEAAEEAAEREILNVQIVEFLDSVGSMNPDGTFNPRGQ